MALRHDRYSDVENRPFPYSHGYYLDYGSPDLPPEREGRGMATVMSAFSNKVPDVPRFSNPNLCYPDSSRLALGAAEAASCGGRRRILNGGPARG